MRTRKIIIVATVLVFAVVSSAGMSGCGTSNSHMRAPGQFPGQNRMGARQGSNGQPMPGNPAGMAFSNMPLSGKVDKVENDTITITTAFGSVKASVTDTTNIYASAAAEQADIQKGDYILVKGEGSMAKVNASLVEILAEDFQQARTPQVNRPAGNRSWGGPPDNRGNRPENPTNRPARDIKDRPLVGKVTAVSDNKMTLEFGFGKTTVTLTDEVEITKAIPGAINDIKTSSQILLQGQGDQTATLDAKAIYILSQ